MNAPNSPTVALTCLLLAVAATASAEPGAAPPSGIGSAIITTAFFVLVVIGPLALGGFVSRRLFKLGWNRPLFYVSTLLIAIPLAVFGYVAFFVLLLFMAGGRTM